MEEETYAIKIRTEKIDFPLVFYIHRTPNFTSLFITDNKMVSLKNIIEECLAEIERDHKEELKTNQNLRNFLRTHCSQTFSSLLLSPFLIPEKEEELLINIPMDKEADSKVEQESISKTEKEEEEENKDENSLMELTPQLKEIYDMIDGTQNIEELLENITEEKEQYKNLEILQLQDILMELFIEGKISLRLPFYSWDKFILTEKAQPYLMDGSKENQHLITKVKTGKIIKLLKIIKEQETLRHLAEKMDISSLRLHKFLSILLRNHLIEKQTYKNEIKNFSEEIIPILTMQGLKKESFDILSKMVQSYQEYSLDEIALIEHIEPQVIKNLIDKYKKATEALS